MDPPQQVRDVRALLGHRVSLVRVGTACNNRGHAVLADRGIGEDRILWTGHITNQGSPWVRGILQEAAQTAKRHPMFAGAYAQLAHRRGNNIATTAIARRLLARCFHILIQLEPAPEKAGTGRARVSA